MAHAQTKSDAVGEAEWLDSAGSTVARAHQHVARARRGSPWSPRRTSTKIYVRCNVTERRVNRFEQ